MKSTKTTWRTTVAAGMAGVLLAGCGAADSSTEAKATATSTSAPVASATTVEEVMVDNLAAEAAEVTSDESVAARVMLDGTTATSDSENVTIDDGTVTISAAGTYVLSGALAGQVVVDTDDDAQVTLILDDAQITSSTTAALAVVEAGSVAVVLAEGSDNALTDAETYAETADTDQEGTEVESPNAALWSSADLTIGGSGSLSVTGNNNDGIGAKDGLVITAGTIAVTAADDGIRGKDYLVVLGGSVSVDADGDGFTSDNDSDASAGYILLDGGDVTIEAGDDGLQAATDGLVAGGSLTLVAADEGIAAAGVIVDDGAVDVTAGDDGINAAGGSPDSSAEESAGTSTEGTEGGGFVGDEGADAAYQVHINGGTVAIHSEGDGLDSNGYATITGGTVTVDGPTDDGNGALDAAGGLTVTGGNLVAIGSAGMAEAPTDDSQGWISATVTGSAGDEIAVVDADGDIVASYTAGTSYASVVASAAGIEPGSSYTVRVDGAEAATATAGEHTAGMGGAMHGAPGDGMGEPSSGPPGQG